MRRIMLVVTVALMMAAMMVAMAAPAIADLNCRTEGTIETCSGGQGTGGGGFGSGSGGHEIIDRQSSDFESSFGGGGGGSGFGGTGGGFHCEGNLDGERECSGKGFSGPPQ